MGRKKKQIQIGNEIKTIDEWLAETEIDRKNYEQRVHTLGWTPEQAIFSPPKTKLSEEEVRKIIESRTGSGKAKGMTPEQVQNAHGTGCGKREKRTN